MLPTTKNSIQMKFPKGITEGFVAPGYPAWFCLITLRITKFHLRSHRSTELRYDVVLCLHNNLIHPTVTKNQPPPPSANKQKTKPKPPKSQKNPNKQEEVMVLK